MIFFDKSINLCYIFFAFFFVNTALSMFLLKPNKDLAKKLVEEEVKIKNIFSAQKICDNIEDSKVKDLIISNVVLKMVGVGESKFMDQNINDYIVDHYKFCGAIEEINKPTSIDDKMKQLKIHLFLKLFDIEKSKEIVSEMNERSLNEKNENEKLKYIDKISQINDYQIRNKTYQLILCDLFGVRDYKSIIEGKETFNNQLDEFTKVFAKINTFNDVKLKGEIYQKLLSSLVDGKWTPNSKHDLSEIKEMIQNFLDNYKKS